ncbi:glycosyltransferase, partial [Patescibacteria group bacterium]|nr:glycosyltransferase [Patescibacteria group bacterium]
KILTKKPAIYVVLEDYRAGIKENKNISWVTRILADLFIIISEAVFLKKTSLIITSDNAIANDYKDKHPNVEIIYNYPILAYFNPDLKSHEISEQYKNWKCIMYHGGITIERGILEMIEAVSIVAQEIKNIKFIIIGTGINSSLRKAMHSICQQYKSQNNISIIHHLDHKQIAYYINVCHLGMVAFRNTPKLNKNIPQKIFEYMACKKPVIGSDLPPISHYINLAKAGILIPPGNTTALVNALKDLLSNPDKATTLGKNGYKYCIQYWNWNLMNKKLFNSYQQLKKT